MSEAPKSEFLSGMIAVFDRDDLDKHDKLIAVYLIRRGALWGKASVFQGTIAKETGVSVATVKRSLNRMQEIGVLKVDRSVGQRSKYTLVLDANPAQGELGVAQGEPPKQEFAQLTQSEGVAQGELGVAQGELGVAQGELGGSSHRARVPKYKAKYKVKDKEKGNSRADPHDTLSALTEDADPAEALVRMYNILDPPDSSNYQRFTVARYQQMQAALDAGATYEIVAQVIQEMAAIAKGPWEVRKEAVRRARGELTGDAGEITAGATRENRKSDRYRGFFSQVL